MIIGDGSTKAVSIQLHYLCVHTHLTWNSSAEVREAKCTQRNLSRNLFSFALTVVHKATHEHLTVMKCQGGHRREHVEVNVLATEKPRKSFRQQQDAFVNGRK